MEIKEFYLDLREGPQYAKKNENVWLLESEMFKEPLKLCVWYDDNDKREIERIKKDCLEIKESLNKEYEKVYGLIEKQTEVLKDIEALKIEEQRIIDWYKELQQEEKEKRKDIKQSKNEIEKQTDWMNKKINELFALLNKKPDRKIFRYHWSEFISWLDPYYWEDINLPSWDYVIIEKRHFDWKNEYCINKDTVEFNSTSIINNYNPLIQLQWSNWIDKPNALVEIDILFFQL